MAISKKKADIACNIKKNINSSTSLSELGTQSCKPGHSGSGSHPFAVIACSSFSIMVLSAEKNPDKNDIQICQHTLLQKP